MYESAKNRDSVANKSLSKGSEQFIVVSAYVPKAKKDVQNTKEILLRNPYRAM